MAELNPTATVARSLFPPGPMRWLESLTAGWSLFGGLLFCLIVAMSIISIVGRNVRTRAFQHIEARVSTHGQLERRRSDERAAELIAV